MRNLVLIVSLLLMCLLGWFYCQSAADCCEQAATIEEAAIVPSSEGGMSECLMFRWSDNEPVLRDDWEECKAGLVSRLRAGEFMEITGLYRSDETNNTSFENLGLARANKVKELLSPEIPEDRITIMSKLVNDDVGRDQLSNSVAYRNYQKSNSVDETIPDRTIIRFAFNSTSKLDDGNVETYLDQVVKRINNSGERMRLTGHTDNIGSDASNKVLGQRRADIIKNYLIQKGVDASKIQTSSQGESAPVATNDTENGRAQNRRVELQIIK